LTSQSYRANPSSTYYKQYKLDLKRNTVFNLWSKSFLSFEEAQKVNLKYQEDSASGNIVQFYNCEIYPKTKEVFDRSSRIRFHSAKADDIIAAWISAY
jgi:hypothetical protein